jgi:non-heme chloroperoxidase
MDRGAGEPIVFSPGWPLTADAREARKTLKGGQVNRVIVHDRRSQGNPDRTWDGDAVDNCADDLPALTDALDRRAAVTDGHSTGGDLAHSVVREPPGSLRRCWRARCRL